MNRGQNNKMIDHHSLDEDRRLFDVTKVDIRSLPKEKLSNTNNTMTIDNSLDAVSDTS